LLLLEIECFDGMTMEAGRARLYRGNQLATGVKIYPLGSHNEGICECGEKLRDCRGKVLEYTRELTGREATDRWANRSVGGTSRSHMVTPHRDFSHGDF